MPQPPALMPSARRRYVRSVRGRQHCTGIITTGARPWAGARASTRRDVCRRYSYNSAPLSRGPAHDALAFDARVAARAAANMAQEGVTLRTLATQAADHSFRQLAALTQSLPGRPENDRRRELLRTLHSMRQMLLRLLVLARWSPRADPAMQFLKIREVLSARDATFHDVATRLVAVHHTVATEPIHDVPAALRVLSAGVLGNAEHLLPSAVEELRPARPPAPDVARLDAALRARLLRTPLPPRLNVLGFAGGLVTLAVAHEFEADLTLGPYTEAAAATDSAAPNQAADAPRLGGWALVRVRLHVRAASATAATQLAESHQRQLCWQLTQRMSGSTQPLHVLLAVLQEFCAFAARDIAVKQAKALAASRWAGAVRLSALPGTPSPGFAIQYWLPAPRASTGTARTPTEAAPRPTALAARSLRVQLDDQRQLVIVHDPSFGDGEAGPRLSLDAIDMDALLTAAVASASHEQLERVREALCSDPAFSQLPPTVLQRGTAAGDTPSLVLPFPIAGAMPPSMRCDWRTGELRLLGAAPMLSTSEVHDLEEFMARSSAVDGASGVMRTMWRRSVCAEVALLARALGMRPLASPKNALRYPTPEAPDLLLQLPPADAALYFAIFMDRAAPTPSRTKWMLLTAAASPSLPAGTEQLRVLPAGLSADGGVESWEQLLHAIAGWAAEHSARTAAEAQLLALGTHFTTLVAPGSASTQVVFDANLVAAGADSGVSLHFGRSGEGGWDASLPGIRGEAPCAGALRPVAQGSQLRYAVMDEHFGGGIPALFADIRALVAGSRQ